jgi:hypothetical protein
MVRSVGFDNLKEFKFFIEKANHWIPFPQRKTAEDGMTGHIRHIILVICSLRSFRPTIFTDKILKISTKFHTYRYKPGGYGPSSSDDVSISPHSSRTSRKMLQLKDKTPK